MDRVKTGVRGLDDLLGGGVPKGFIVGVIGGPGAGKSILGLQFIWQGISDGEDVLYIALEGGTDRIEQQAAQFGWGLNGSQRFHTFTQGSEDVKMMVSRISEHVKKYNVKRLVIDSMSLYNLFTKAQFSYDLQFARVGLKTMSEKSNRLIVDEVRGSGLTTIALVEDYEGMPNEDKILEFACGGVIHLSTNPALDTRSLRIVKMRETKHPLGASQFEIKDNGIELHKKAAEKQANPPMGMR